jgi:hypothetical protein
MAILGLMPSSQLASEFSNNVRRTVFHQYPTGKFPLMGLLSLMDTDGSDKPVWGWEEKRNITHETVTQMANAAGPFTATDGSNGAVGTNKTTAGWGDSAGTTIRVELADVTFIGVRDVLMFRNVPGTSSSIKTFRGVVSAVYTAHSTVDVLLLETVANVLNDTTANGIAVINIGNAASEADRSKTGFTQFPTEISNYTQIFRQPFHFSRTALAAGVKWDKTGIYKTTAKDNSLKHMVQMERAALWGIRTSNATTNDDGETSIRRTTGGLLWFLQQWEKGNTGNGGAFDYRPGGSDISASAWNASDDKRILDINGTVTADEFENIIERAFRHTSETSFEKLWLAGSGIMSVLNKFVARQGLKMTKLMTDEAYGMNVSTYESPHGIIHVGTHPLLSQTPAYRNSGFILDIGNLIYTPLNGADTELYKNRQAPDYDGRKDEWLTEFGLEIRFPESHMFIDRLTGIV